MFHVCEPRLKKNSNKKTKPKQKWAEIQLELIVAFTNSHAGRHRKIAVHSECRPAGLESIIVIIMHSNKLRKKRCQQCTMHIYETLYMHRHHNHHQHFPVHFVSWLVRN